SGDRDDALEIASSDCVEGRAQQHCVACGLRSTLPVIDERAATDEATIPVPRDPEWRVGFTVINPADAGAVVNVVAEDGRQTVVAVAGRWGRATVAGDSTLRTTACRPRPLRMVEPNARSAARWSPSIAPAATAPRSRRAMGPRSSPGPQTAVLTPSK